MHGERRLPRVAVESYSLEIEDSDGLVGDKASQTAFRELLAQWRVPSDQLDRKEVDRLAREGDDRTVRTVALAVAEFADRLAQVVGRFRRHPGWRGVERIAIGGGFKESEVGRLAVRLAAQRLDERAGPGDLRLLHHGADDAGMVGWVHAMPDEALEGGDALLAVDLGGTNLRCGLVTYGERAGADWSASGVDKREVWRHADDAVDREQIVERMAQVLQRMADYAEQHGMTLARTVGVSCPGIVEPDGRIARGADNLPGDWHAGDFHLPELLERQLDGRFRVLLHNDAVVQGLSELPCMRDVDRWAVLTIGTGLGNASYRNLEESGG